MEKLLEVKNLNVSYHTYAGEVKSVRGVDFGLCEGETLAIVGESGCGKSVTAKSIMGLIQTPPGEIKKGSEIIYRGKNVLDFSEKQLLSYRGAESSMIFQDALTSLNPTMTVGNQIIENITTHNKVKKKVAEERAIEMLKLVGIPDPEMRLKQYPHEFSGGMRQRVMIAIALACNPKLLIADEPTTALDVTIQAQIIDLIVELQKKLGTAVILITHDLGVVAGIAKNVIVMYSGKIMEYGSCDEIFYNSRHPYTQALINSVPRIDLKNKQDLFQIEGTPPDLFDPPKGCPFSTRCKYCMNICVSQEAEKIDFDGGHYAYCWLYDSRAPEVDITQQISRGVNNG